MVALLTAVHLLTCEVAFIHMKDSARWAHDHSEMIVPEKVLRCESDAEVCFYFEKDGQRAVSCVKK